ncbi:MAG TPA: LptF/LptG family permease, partial [Verrucomicrobiae bacterium]|nr:LptF/LptG family permease [Verrucomicrobiae bacterium]
AMLYTLTYHARHNEITAIRAAGVSLWRLCMPYFAVGLLTSILLFALNELFVPGCAILAQNILNEHSTDQVDSSANRVRNLSFINAPQRRDWQIGVYDARTARMFNPQVHWTLPDGSGRWLFSDSAIYTNGAWTFFNVREFKELPNTNAMPVPIVRTNVLVVPGFTETPAEIKSEIFISDRLSIRKAKEVDIPISELLDYLRWHPNPSPQDRDWLYTKLYGRLAAPWTCLVVVLIAIPFGAASGRRNVFMGVAGSIFICFAYFVLLQLGLALGTGGYLPAWFAAWFPNLAFGIAGLWLTARVR